MTQMKDTSVGSKEIALELGITEPEYAHVVNALGRTPNYAELGIFSSMFSEHCSYKSSKHALKSFPTTGSRVLQGPGENAGILDVGHGYGVAFKMESHNHPSFIEPYQGAATGVGGILRDVFTMGARPIASMNCLFFGEPKDSHTKRVAPGVVRGIGDYGNCVGVPTVGGQTFFHSSYNRNPLVNAFTLGLIKKNEIFRGLAKGEGNLVVYVGAKTGRDGVHGATMASKEFSTDKDLERPTVQVGDPFTEKLLLEATLEVLRQNLVVGIQDMGAAGLTSSSFEMAHRAGTGMLVNLDNIPTREPGMSAYELLLSESQERMLLVCRKEKWEPLQKVYDKWDLHSEIIGEVTNSKRIVMTKAGETVVDLPVELVAEPLMAPRPAKEPANLEQRWALDLEKIYDTPWEAKLDAVLKHHNFASPRAITQQYDSMVGNRTLETHSDAALIRLRDVEQAQLTIGLSADCNPRICWLHPSEGAKRAVSESAINLACRGTTPIGITDCLNFGNPENPEIMWQLEQAISGMAEACTILDTPVVSGNVSLYNDTDGTAIYPTPMVGMVGLREGSSPPNKIALTAGLEISLVGKPEAGLGGTVLVESLLGVNSGKPTDTDLAEVLHCVKFLLHCSESTFPYTAHDISEGGLVTALAESLFGADTHWGADITLSDSLKLDECLLGEASARVLLIHRSENHGEIEALAKDFGLRFTPLGSIDDSGEIKIKTAKVQLPTIETNKIFQGWKHRWDDIFN